MKKVEERDFLDRRREGKNRRKGVATAGESGGPSRQSESSQELLTPSSILSPPLDLESQPSPWFNVPPPSGRRKQGRSLFCDPSQIQIPPSSPLIVFIIDRLWHPIISMLFLYFLCNICVYISRERSWLFWKRCKKKEHGNIGLLLARRRRRKDKQIISTLHFLDISEWCCIEIRRREKKDGGPKRLSPRPDKTSPKGLRVPFHADFSPLRIMNARRGGKGELFAIEERKERIGNAG